MPKMKTNKTAAKKYKVSARGKLRRGQACTSHNTGKKSAKQLRRLRGEVAVSAADAAGVRKMLPYLNK